MALDYFTEAELRALPDMADVGRFPLARCEAAAGYIVGVIEREVGTSFVGRQVVETHHGGAEGIVLDEPVLSVVSVTEGGVSVPSLDLVIEDGLLYRLTSGWPRSWGSGFANVVVTYLSGYSATPPADVKEMALKGTRAHLLATEGEAGMDDRRTSINTDMGLITFSVAGSDRPTGYPEVDAMIAGWKTRIDIGSFA